MYKKRGNKGLRKKSSLELGLPSKCFVVASNTLANTELHKDSEEYAKYLIERESVEKHYQ